MGMKFDTRDDEIAHYHDVYIQLFKKLVKERRRVVGLTQEQLAEIVGLRQPAISRLENPNYTKINLETIQRVATGLDCVVSIGLIGRTEINHEREKSL